MKTKYTVSVRFQFIQFGEVDTVSEKFNCTIKITSKWHENQLIENYDKTKHWNPQLFIENCSIDKYQESIEYSFLRIVNSSQTLITETRICKGQFWERMELNDFPFDIQELSISLCSNHDSNECKLEINNRLKPLINASALTSFHDQQRFKLYRLVNVSDRASYDAATSSLLLTKRKPKLVATCYCSRQPIYYIVNGFSYVFLITMLSLTLFAIDIKSVQSRISGSFTLILTSFNFKISTSKSLPAISYVTNIEKYQILSLIYLAICCAWHSILGSLQIDMNEKNRLDKWAISMLTLVFIGMQIMFAVLLYVSYLKIKQLKQFEQDYTFNLKKNDIQEDDYYDYSI